MRTPRSATRRLPAQQQLVQYLGPLRLAQERIAIQQASLEAAQEDLRVQQQRYTARRVDAAGTADDADPAEQRPVQSRECPLSGCASPRRSSKQLLGREIR